MALPTGDPRQIVLDAGPLIGLLNRRDRFRDESIRGFRQLDRARTRFLVPSAIVFEVFKWLLFHTDLTTARVGLVMMLERVEIEHLGPTGFSEVMDLMQARQRWPGSLEDATVAQLALRRGLSVWTFNYRDFVAFPTIQYWNPI